MDIISNQDSEEVYDNSMISCYLDCPRKYYYQYHLRIGSPLSPNITFGAAIHDLLSKKGEKNPNLNPTNIIADYYSKHCPDLIIDDIFGIERADLLSQWLWKQEEQWDRIGSEIGFAVNLGKKGYNYGGKIDLIVSKKSISSSPIIVDFKITKGATQYYINNSYINRQITGYIFAINLIQNCNSQWGIIQSIDYKRSLLKKCTLDILKSFVSNSDTNISDPPYSTQNITISTDEIALDSWLEETITIISSIKKSFNDERFIRVGNCGSSYQVCPFVNLCVQYPSKLPLQSDCQGYNIQPAWMPWKGDNNE